MTKEKTYLQKLLNGTYGEIEEKHKKLAELIYDRQPELDNPNKLEEYVRRFKKYDNFTFRDLDKALAYSTKIGGKKQ